MPDRSSARVLVVEDDDSAREYLTLVLQRHGLRVTTAPDGRRAVGLFEAGLEVEAALLDVGLPGMDGIETLRRIRELRPGLPVIMVSGREDVPTVVAAARLGVIDFINKPYDPAELARAIDAAVACAAPRAEARRPGSVEKPRFWEGVGMAGVRDTIAQIADTDASIVIQGETGVGKEVVARAIHEASNRAHRPFVKVLCAALPSQLLESELFGFEKGAFTDARAQKKGRFELAEGGTIFLDEIGEMGPDLQPKLLQVLQDREFHRLGGNEPIKVDVRVICATHRPLEEMVRDGRFRSDLFYRLNVVQIQVPPLRTRRDEIPALFDGFVAHYAAKYRRPVPVIGPEIRERLARSSFPGNVRELENLAKRLVVLGPPKAAVLEWRAPEMRAADDFARTAGEVPLLEVRRRVSREVERAVIDCALMATGWNRREAARRLNLSYSTMLEKMKECGLRDAADRPGGETDGDEADDGFDGSMTPASQPGL